MQNAIYKTLCKIQQSLHLLSQKEIPGQVSTSVVAVTNTGEVPQIIASQNPRRKEIWIHNAGNQPLFLAPFQGVIQRDLYSLSIPVSDTLIMNAETYAGMYKGDIYGFWDVNVEADARAMVTEFFAQ